MGTRVHRYEACCEWRGTTGNGYESYSREHTVWAPPSPARLRVTADPAFRGDPQLLNPEQLLVMAAASCQLLSFLALAARAGIEVLEYSDRAVAEMPEDRFPIWIGAIRLEPRIVVSTGTELDAVARTVHQAHEECYIANSLRTEITICPTLLARD